MEEAGELAATEMPDRAARMHCAHGEGSARFAARSRRVRGVFDSLEVAGLSVGKFRV